MILSGGLGSVKLVPVRFPSIGQIELFNILTMCKQMTDLTRIIRVKKRWFDLVLWHAGYLMPNQILCM